MDAIQIDTIEDKSPAVTWCVIITVLAFGIAAWSLWQQEDLEQALADSRADYADAMIEVERLEARLSTCMEIKHQLRNGVID